MNNTISTSEIIKILSIVFLLIVFLTMILLHVVSKMRSMYFLKMHSGDLLKITFDDSQKYVDLAHEALEHYVNICTKSFSAEKVAIHSEYFYIIMKNIMRNIKKLGTTEECNKKILEFSQKAEDHQKMFSKTSWPNTPKNLSRILVTLKNVSSDMALIWEEKSNEYIY